MRWVARLWPLLAVAMLLAVVAVLAQLGHVTIHSVPPKPNGQGGADGLGAAPPSPVPTFAPPTAVAIGKTDNALKWIAAGLIILALVGVLAVLVIGLVFVLRDWRLRRGPRRAGPSADTSAASFGHREDVIAAVDASLAALAGDGSGDARAAVIACWVRLEEVAALAGTPREAGDTPSDLVGRLLATQQVSRGALTELADLYRTARYSTWEIDETMRERAYATLGRLREELGRSHAAALAAAGPVHPAAPAGHRPPTVYPGSPR